MGVVSAAQRIMAVRPGYLQIPFKNRPSLLNLWGQQLFWSRKSYHLLIFRKTIFSSNFSDIKDL